MFNIAILYQRIQQATNW